METVASSIVIPDGPCIEMRVRTNSIRFGNRYINLQRLATTINCTEGYLSKALRDPDRSVSIHLLKRMALALGLSLDQVVTLMDDRKKMGNRGWNRE